jgi:PGF-pre-PGF domain-containing protein
VSPEDREILSIYGAELNFSINSTLFSSYGWFINGNSANGTGITLYNNTDDSSKVSYCIINSSQFISQNNFFMDIYNISVQASNESIGRTDTHSWLWTVTESSATDEGDIDIMINTTPQVTVNGSEKYLRFNTTNNIDQDDNGLACSIISTSFNTSNNTDGIQIKVEVLNTSSINKSSIDFSINQVYQYLDISFNNESLVNNESHSRNIEFRVLNTKDGGRLIVNTVYLRHWNSLEWEPYAPELIGDDGTYSYFIVRNVSGFSPFAVICDYSFSSGSTSISNDGLPAYLKWLMFKDKMEDVEKTVNTELSESVDESNLQTEDTIEISDSQVTTNLATHEAIDDSNSGYVYWIIGIGFVLILGLVARKKQKGEGGL